MEGTGILEELTNDFTHFRGWLKENGTEEVSANWETDSMRYTALTFHGFRFSIAVCKEDQIEDYIKVTKLDPEGDYDNDVEVAYIYNLNAPGTEATARLIVEDTDALLTLERCISTAELAKDLNRSLSVKAQTPKRSKKAKL